MPTKQTIPSLSGEVSDPWKPDNSWQRDAKYHENGLPANMSAILHEQWKRMKQVKP